MYKALVLLLAALLVSCSLLPFGKKTTAKPPTTEKGEVVAQTDQPKPGDVRIIDGVEYIYARNRRYQLTPYEPEYEWVRKDQYSPGVFDSISDRMAGGDAAAKKDHAELEKRMTKLEDDLKQKNTLQPAAYPAQPGGFQSLHFMGPVPPVSFPYPSPKMKRRVLILPFADMSNYKEEHLDELTTKRIVARLEDSGTIIPVDPHTLNLSGDLSTPEAMKTLNEVYGIQAVIKGSLSDVYTSTSKIDGRDDKEVSFALSKISLDIYNTETGKLLRQLSARNPFFLSRENGDMSPDRAKVKAIDLAIELIADDLLKTLLSLDWHARIATIENDKVFINAGRLSGLDKGDILEVYAPGAQIIDKTTKLPLGRAKGSYKGEIEVVEVFGVDASWAKAGKTSTFVPTDLVYLKKK
ncbi:MAG: hypothetical protein ABSC19_01340 [Syntrophorhabdales bacterium]|jgi:hypothetical protein